MFHTQAFWLRTLRLNPPLFLGLEVLPLGGCRLGGCRLSSTGPHVVNTLKRGLCLGLRP